MEGRLELEEPGPEGEELELAWLISKKRAAWRTQFDWGKLPFTSNAIRYQLLSWELFYEVIYEVYLFYSSARYNKISFIL